jgi:hypothetical protein
MRKNLLEILAASVAMLGVIGAGLYMLLPVVCAWWAAHWILLTIIGSVLTVGGTCQKWIPLCWKVYTTITDYADVQRIREHHYLMLGAVTDKMVEGYDATYDNESHGFKISVHNPYVKGMTKIQEVVNPQLEAPIFPQPRDFAEILGSFAPNQNSIFLLDTLQGPITVPMNDVCHVALGGPTGGGKTNTTRLLAAQILSCDGLMYMANPNFAPVKLNGQRLEDWRPIAARLQEPPAREIDEIKALLSRFMKLFEERRRQEQTSPRRGKDVFLILGEWPAIVARWKEAPQILGMLLRESRQYGIHVISEFQDALISTIGGNSGVRENYRTAYYFGGDLNTAKVLLDLPKGEKIDDAGLGSMGAVYLRSKANRAAPGRVPMFSNRSLYALLGTPADPVGDNLVLSMDDLPDEFLPFVDSNLVTPSTRSIWQGESNFSKQFDARDDEPKDEPLSSIDPDCLYAQENAMNGLADEAQETQEGELKYVLDTVKIELFTVAYRITGNIDESLKYASAHTGYRAHARQIIVERGLKRGN